MKKTVLCVALLAVVALWAENHKDKIGFLITPDGIATTNEATKGNQPRKVLVNCKYVEASNAISDCELAPDATLTELVVEFEARDTKRVKEMDMAVAAAKKK